MLLVNLSHVKVHHEDLLSVHAGALHRLALSSHGDEQYFHD